TEGSVLRPVSRLRLTCLLNHRTENAVAQHRVQLTVGTRRVFWAFVWLWVFSVSRANPPSYTPQLTHTVGLPPTLT
ncbi:MAG: hypothetical protein ABIU06_05205, partial [Anaerolineales bacterium]